MYPGVSVVITPVVHLAERWATLYNAHTALQTAVAFAHVGGLLVAGGLAIASDRSTLRALRGGEDARRRALEELHAVHRPVLAGLAVVAASGVLLFAADLQTFVSSPLYWAKLALVALLLVNGARLGVVERRLLSGAAGSAERDARDWRRLRAIALASITLWLATSFAGTLLVNAAT